MKITVFGANGRIGRLVAARLLKQGHTVKAFVHGDHSLGSDDRLIIVNGDIYNSKDVDNAISDTDVVISTLGSWGTKKKDVLTTGMQQIILAMKSHNVSRIISLTGADALAPAEKLGILRRVFYTFISIMAGKILHDGEEHIRLLNDSSLGWTVLRSPVMKSENNSNYNFTTKRPYPWQTIPRQAVADALVDLVDSKEYSRQSPFLHNKK